MAGEDITSDGTAYGNVRKALGVGPASIVLSQDHVLWYGRRDPSADPFAGIYVGDDEHAPSTLTVNAGYTFNQTVTLMDMKRVQVALGF